MLSVLQTCEQHTHHVLARNTNAIQLQGFDRKGGKLIFETSLHTTVVTAAKAECKDDSNPVMLELVQRGSSGQQTIGEGLLLRFDCEEALGRWRWRLEKCSSK